MVTHRCTWIHIELRTRALSPMTGSQKPTGVCAFDAHKVQHGSPTLSRTHLHFIVVHGDLAGRHLNGGCVHPRQAGAVAPLHKPARTIASSNSKSHNTLHGPHLIGHVSIQLGGSGRVVVAVILQ